MKNNLFFFLYFNSAIHHYFHYSRLKFQRVCHNFCQVLASPPVRVCRRLTILSARDPKFDERLRDLLPRPAYFQVARSCIFSPLLDSLSWSLLEFSPTGKAETFLCNHALFIHLVIKRGQTLKLHRSFRKTLSPLHLKVRKCPQTEIYEWQLWRLKPIHKHLNGQNAIQTHNRYLSVPMSLTTMYGMCVFTCPWLIEQMYNICQFMWNFDSLPIFSSLTASHEPKERYFLFGRFFANLKSENDKKQIQIIELHFLWSWSERTLPCAAFRSSPGDKKMLQCKQHHKFKIASWKI